MSLRSKIVAMLVAPAVVLLAATATSYYAESRAAQTSRAVENSYEVKLKVASLQGDLTSAESALRGWVLTGREDFVVSFTTSADKVPADVTELASSVQDDPELREDVIRLRTLVTELTNPPVTVIVSASFSTLAFGLFSAAVSICSSFLSAFGRLL